MRAVLSGFRDLLVESLWWVFLIISAQGGDQLCRINFIFAFFPFLFLAVPFAPRTLLFHYVSPGSNLTMLTIPARDLF